MAAIVSALTNAYHLYSNFGDFKAQLMEGITQLKTGTPEQNLAYLATKYNELQGIFTQAQAATHEMQEVVTEVEEIEKTCMGIERSLFAQTSAHGATGTIGVVGTAFSMFTNDVNSVPWLKEVSVVLIVVSMVFAFKNSRDFHQAKQAEKTKNAYLQETKNKLKEWQEKV